jgi:hypothetical protein
MLVVKLGELRMLVLKNTGGNRVRDFKRKASRLSAGRYRHVAIGLVCRMKGLSHLERITLGYIVLRLHVSRENAHGRSARHEIQLLLLTVWIPDEIRQADASLFIQAGSEIPIQQAHLA